MAKRSLIWLELLENQNENEKEISSSCIRRRACVCPTIKLKPNVKIYKRLATVEKRRNVTSIPTDSNCLFFFQLRNERKKAKKNSLYTFTFVYYL